MQHIGFLVSTLSSPGGTGRVVANVANRMVEDYEVHVIGAYHSGDGEPAFAYDSRVHRLNILPKEPRIREANKELKKPLIDYIEQNHIEVLFLIGNYQGAYTMSTMPACKSCKFVFCDHGALMNEWNNKPIRFIRFLASVLSDMTAVLTSGAHAKRAGSSAISFAAHRRELGTIAVSIPFFAYTACFLLAPTVIVIVGAFQSADGSFTVANFNKLFEANTIAAFGTSILVSVASAVIGAIVGALASYALVIGSKPNGLLRRMISAISSVLAQFGGVMLAFAFIATIGINGVGTMLIKQLTGYVVNPNWLSSLPGLITIYCYFQIPLMIIIFLPAVDSIRPQWREATESLGGNTFQYWTRVAGPILAPRFISAFLLLFASAFSAYATAAALFSQRSILVPLMIQGAMRNEMDPNQQGFAQVLAFAMIVVVAVVMMISHAVEKRAGRWQ